MIDIQLAGAYINTSFCPSFKSNFLSRHLSPGVVIIQLVLQKKVFLFYLNGM